MLWKTEDIDLLLCFVAPSYLTNDEKNQQRIVKFARYFLLHDEENLENVFESENNSHVFLLFWIIENLAFHYNNDINKIVSDKICDFVDFAVCYFDGANDDDLWCQIMSNYCFLRIAAQSINIDSENLWLLIHEDTDIRIDIAKNSNTSRSLLHYLAQDKNEFVRLAVAEISHIHLHPETMHILSQDDSSRVQLALYYNRKFHK